MPLPLYLPEHTGPYRRLFTSLLNFVGEAPKAMLPDNREDFALRAS